MMMFAIAAALIVTGGTLGTPWLTGFFNSGDNVSSANEAGIACPPSLVGLALISDAEVVSRGDLFELECDYVLPPSTELSASVSVVWTESGPVNVLQRGCGLPPSTSPGVFSVEGSHYGALGQSRSDYKGETRYANAMRKLSSDLAAAAASVSEPCPEQVVVTNPGVVGDGQDPVNDGSGDSSGQIPGQGSGGSSGGSTGSGGVSIPDGGSLETGQSSPDGGSGGSSQGEAVGTVVVPSDVPEGSCLVRGRVTDSRGIAVPMVRIEIHAANNSVLLTGATGETGAYGFGQPVEANGRVVLVPTDGGRAQPIFHIFAQQADVTLSRALSANQIEDGICEMNFDIWDLGDNYASSDGDTERWPSIIELYQNYNRAAELAVQVGAPFDYGLPIPIYAWCDSRTFFCDPTGEAEFAFYAGSSTGRTVLQPFMALGFPSSDVDYRGAPDNREYHEFGHAFFADVQDNQIPIHVGDTNHGGYYRNEMTTDSFVEGFAEFYSVMVSKHIEQVENPQRYKIGAEYDIEADRKPWEAVGWWEEFTLAGLLLDFEDGPEDYASTSDVLDVESVSSLNAETGNFAIGRVRNLSTKVARSPEVTIELLDSGGNTVFKQVTSVRPESLGPGQTGVFYVAAPDGIEFSDVAASPGRPVSSDDDDIDLDLADLLRTITDDWGAGPNRVTNIRELYETLSEAYAGADTDGDSVPDVTQEQIDAIFIRHGFFDDLDGDRQWNPENDGSIGGTAHPEATIALNQFPAMTPRSSAIGFPGSFVDVNTGDVDSEILVQVELADSAQSYSYWAPAGNTTPVELAVPEAIDGASVTVIAAADDKEPAVAYRTTAQQFHAAVESGEIRTEPVRTTVQLQEGNPFALLGSPDDGGASGSTRQGGPPWTVLLTISLAMLMLAGGFYMMKRTSVPAEMDRD